ncbi:BamA/TamA family outer membrane protein [Phormidesmis sp. 146-12]
MRLSPVLMAAFAAVTTVSWSNSAQAKTPGAVSKPEASRAQIVDANVVDVFSGTSIAPTPRSTSDVVVKTISAPETALPEPLKIKPFQKGVEKVAQGVGEDQGTPNRIQINTSPTPTVPSTSPPPTTPVPDQPSTPENAAPGTQPTTPENVTPGTTPTTPENATPGTTPTTPENATPGTTPPIAPFGTPTQPAAPGTPGAPPTTPPESAEPEPRVLVGEVVVTGAEGATITPELQDEVYRAIRTTPGRTTTRSQLQEDINAVFATGFFSNVRATPEDTPVGVRVTFEVQPNPVLKSVQLEGAKVVPANVVNDIFSPQYGTTLNLRQLQTGIQALNKWYQDNGFVLAQVVDVPKVNPDGTVTLQIAEGVVENLQVRFINKQGEDKDAKGNVIRGRTRDFIITREFELKPGDVFNRKIAEQDLQRAFGLGIFDDIRLSLSPGQDPRQVVVVVNVAEKNTGNVGLAGGFSSASGLFGSVSYQQQNVGGNNQKFNAEVQIGQRDQLFDLSFTDPWIANDPYRTSYTFSLFRRQTISLVFDGGDPEVDLPNGDRPRILRTGGGLTFTRPLSKTPFKRSEWTASLGLQYQRVSVRDQDGELSPRDALGNLLTFSDSGKDDLLTARLGFVRDRRNNFLTPTSGSVLSFSTEQSAPLGSGSIFFNRLRANYSFYVPVRFTRLTPGCRDNQRLRIGEKPPTEGCPQALAFNVQGGTVLGDLPPYEAFPLGGTNSVRGYDEGEVGSGRSYIQATAEYRFPIFSIISGALFVDAASDLGTGQNVPGDPAGVRDKPGFGFGYGVGVRVQTGFLGAIRIDFGLNDQGGNNIRFGFGERF